MRSIRLFAGLLAAILVVAPPATAVSLTTAATITPCRLQVLPPKATRYRIDSVLAVPGALVALAGSSRRTGRFATHDRLLIIRGGKPPSAIRLPAYSTPPGVARDKRGPVDVVVDGTVLLLNLGRNRFTGRGSLHLSALGWPAAVATGPGRLYVAGETSGGFPAAAVEGLDMSRPQRPSLLWRVRLGFYHAGIWLARAGRLLVAYAPGIYDSAGSVTLLDAQSGGIRGSYSVAAPPLAVDARHRRLYLAVNGFVQVLHLSNGRRIASVPGSGPVTAGLRDGLVAFRRDGMLIVANGKSLHVMGKVRMAGIQTLAEGWKGSDILAGRQRGLETVRLTACSASNTDSAFS